MTATSPMSPAAVKWLFVGIGACAVIIGLGWLGYSELLVANSNTADGVVVGQQQEDSSTRDTDRLDGHALFAPVVSFQTGDGRTVQFTSLEYVARSEYPLGRKVRVLYPPARPERAEIDSPETLWLGGAIWLAGGLACIASGFGIARVMNRMRQTGA
jgi:Protein of unknown function (DUF3592)